MHSQHGRQRLVLNFRQAQHCRAFGKEPTARYAVMSLPISSYRSGRKFLILRLNPALPPSTLSIDVEFFEPS